MGLRLRKHIELRVQLHTAGDVWYLWLPCFIKYKLYFRPDMFSILHSSVLSHLACQEIIHIVSMPLSLSRSSFVAWNRNFSYYFVVCMGVPEISPPTEPCHKQGMWIVSYPWLITNADDHGCLFRQYVLLLVVETLAD